MIALKLAKAGWWGGDPGKIMRAPSSEVLAVVEYQAFVSDYEQASLELNKEPA